MLQLAEPRQLIDPRGNPMLTCRHWAPKSLCSCHLRQGRAPPISAENTCSIISRQLPSSDPMLLALLQGREQTVSAGKQSAVVHSSVHVSHCSAEESHHL